MRIFKCAKEGCIAVFCCVLSAVMALTAFAFDNTVSNEFWDTRGYVNANPDSACAALSAEWFAWECFAAAVPMDSAFMCFCDFTDKASDPIRQFNSWMPGFLLFIK